MKRCLVAMDDKIPNCGKTWQSLSTYPQPLEPRRLRTPDGWVRDRQSKIDVWAGFPFAPLVPVSTKYHNEMPETARLGPPPLGPDIVGCGRGVPQPLAP